MEIWENVDVGVQTVSSINRMRGEIPSYPKKQLIMGQRLDTYDKMPSAMKNYLSLYGWHFSKKMCEWAVSKMEVENKATKQKEKLVPIKKEEVEELLKKYGIKLEKDSGYDCVYVANMAKADYYKSSIIDESHLALFLKDYIDDPDGYDGLPFTRFYADCIGIGTPIMWDDML